MKKSVVLMAVIILIIATVNPAGAVNNTKKFALGLQSSFPVFGFSGKYWINDLIGTQAIIGLSSRYTSFAGRGIYKFVDELNYDVWAGVELSFWNLKYSGWDYDKKLDKWVKGSNQSSVGFGIFGGGEYFPIKDIPQIGFSLELGLHFVSFSDDYGYNVSPLSFGFGVHYYFK